MAHPTYSNGHLTYALPNAQRVDLRELRKSQYLISAFNRWGLGLVGDEAGLLTPARNTYNFADGFYQGEVVAASGRRITLRTDEDPRVMGVAAGYDVTDLGRVNGKIVWGVPQPRDLLKFSAKSCLAEKSQPEVVQVVSLAQNGASWDLVLDVNQDVSNAMYSWDVTDTDATIYATLWREAGDPEQWLQIIDPTYFRGVPRSVRIRPSSCDANGHFRLRNAEGSDTAVAHYLPAAGIWGPTMAITGIDSEGNTTDITATVAAYASADNRLFHETLGAGSYRTTICCGGTKFDGSTPYGASLWDSYTAIDITYYWCAGVAHTDDTISTAEFVPCYGRCRYAMRDHDDCIGNYPHSDGVGVDSAGRHWYCRLRRVDAPTVVNTSEPPEDPAYEYEHHWYKPTGVANFPSDGQCMQAGVCNAWAPLEEVGGAASGEHPFKVWSDFARWYRECWARYNIALDMGLMQPDASGWVLYRVGGPSLRGLLGGGTPAPPGGFHHIIQYLGYGGMYARVTEISVDGVPQFATHTGYAYDDAHDWSGFDIDNPATYPPAGHFAALVAGWSNRVDPLTGQPYTDTTDPYRAARYAEDRAGYELDRYLGGKQGRGYHMYTRVHADEPLYVPVINMGLKDEDQVRDDVTWHRYTTAVTVDGVECGAKLTITRMIANGAEASALASRTVVSVESLGDGEYAVTLANTAHSWTEQDTLDEIVHAFEGGGGPGFLPPRWMRVNDFNDSPSDGDAAAVRPGDTMLWGGRHFVVVRAIPHGGAAAGAWGGDTPPDGLAVCGKYTTYGKRQDLVVVRDERSKLAALAPTNAVEFYRGAATWAEAPSVRIAKAYTDDFTAFSTLVHDNGAGAIWVGAAEVNAITHEEGCLLL